MAEVELAYYLGDEAILKAVRATSSTACEGEKKWMWEKSHELCSLTVAA